MKMITHLHLVLRSRIVELYFCSPIHLLGISAYLPKHRDNFTFKYFGFYYIDIWLYIYKTEMQQIFQTSHLECTWDKFSSYEYVTWIMKKLGNSVQIYKSKLFSHGTLTTSIILGYSLSEMQFNLIYFSALQLHRFLVSAMNLQDDLWPLSLWNILSVLLAETAENGWSIQETEMI